MQRFVSIFAAAVLGISAAATAAPSPLQVASAVLVERRSPAADGTVRVTLMPAKRVVPGDRMVFALDYLNTGNRPLADVVFDNPVPAAVVYRAPQPGSPEPLVSVDGKTFGALATLQTGGRPATTADVRIVRWRFAAPIAAGGSGRVAFQAVLK